MTEPRATVVKRVSFEATITFPEVEGVVVLPRRLKLYVEASDSDALARFLGELAETAKVAAMTCDVMEGMP